MSEATVRLFAIRGYMKSGTNWLCNLLNLHPDISCVGEFHWERIIQPLEDLQTRLAHLPQGDELRRQSTSHLQELIAATITAANRSGARWRGDRTPGTIDYRYLPHASFFNIVRDGRDALVSRAFHLLRRPDTTHLFESDDALRRNLKSFQQDPNYFQNAPEELLSSEKLVRQTAKAWAHVIKVNEQAEQERPEQVCTVRYETLHEQTERTRQAIYEFLDVDPALARPLDHRTQPGFLRERPQGLMRKGTVGDWQSYFTDEVTQWFNDEAGSVLKTLGYS